MILCLYPKGFVEPRPSCFVQKFIYCWLICPIMSSTNSFSSPGLTGSPPARDSQTFTLSSGDILGYAEYGLDTAPPIFYCHGCPGSRLEAELWAGVVVAAGVRLIGVDRPGIGLSSFRAGRKFSDWPETLVELAQHLDIHEFSILAHSGGAPYALVCAKALPSSQLRKVTIACGRGPPWLGTRRMAFSGKLLMFMYTWLPFTMRRVFDWMLLGAARDPDPNVFKQMMLKGLEAMSEPDRLCLKDDKLATALVESVRESAKQGSEGIAYDARLLGSWDLTIEDIDFGVKLWCGEEDTNCPSEMSREIAQRLRHGELKVVPGEGHVSLPLNYGEEMLRELSAM